MTRLMGDATHDAVAALAAAGTDMVAGYVTGSPSVVWTAADWALFAGIPQVTIDQGFTGSPVMTAVVRDVEAGAWTAAAAADRTGWTAARPTIYTSLNALPALAATGWRGDIWVAWYDGVPGLNFHVPAGMNCVAKQYTDTGGGGAYDLSAVFDPSWPGTDPPPAAQEDAMLIEGTNGAWYLLTGGRMHHISDPAALHVYQAMGLPQAGSPVSAGEEAALLASFPAGNPAVTVPPVTVTPSAMTGTITLNPV